MLEYAIVMNVKMINQSGVFLNKNLKNVSGFMIRRKVNSFEFALFLSSKSAGINTIIIPICKVQMGGNSFSIFGMTNDVIWAITDKAKPSNAR
jgi:hypothetical protein